MTSPDDIAHDPVGARRPDPDPTVLTTQALFREIGTLRELFEQRIDALEAERDRATVQSAHRTKVLNRERVEQFTAQRELLNERITALRSLTDERFASAEHQRIEQKQDTKAAVDAALSAAKEAVKEQTTASGLSISKSETATREQLAQRHFHTQRIAHMRDQLNGQQRMAAQFKKVIEYANALNVQHLTPDIREEDLRRRAWRNPGRGLVGLLIGHREQRLLIDLPTRQERPICEHHVTSGKHRSWQPFSQPGT